MQPTSTPTTIRVLESVLALRNQARAIVIVANAAEDEDPDVVTAWLELQHDLQRIASVQIRRRA